MLLFSSTNFFFKINLSKKFLQEHYHSVKWLRSSSGPIFCRSWSGSKLFAKVIIRRQKAPLAKKEYKLKLPQNSSVSMHISERNRCFPLSVTILRLFINANLGDDILHPVWSQLQGFDDLRGMITKFWSLPCSFIQIHFWEAFHAPFQKTSVYLKMGKHNSRTFPGLYFQDFFHFSRTQFLPNVV